MCRVSQHDGNYFTTHTYIKTQNCLSIYIYVYEFYYIAYNVVYNEFIYIDRYRYEFCQLQMQEVSEKKGKGRNEPNKRLLQR